MPVTKSSSTNASEQLVATLISDPQVFSLDNPLIEKITAALGAPGLNWLEHGIACDIDLSPGISRQEANEIIRPLISDLPVDCAIQIKSARRKSALIADMDSTMIDQECIDELAAEVGLKDHVAAITARAMNGEIEFEPALRERVLLLKGLPAAIADTVITERITLAKGGRTLIATLRKNGFYCALVSGGFTLFTEKIAKTLGFDENRANILEVDDGCLTGVVREPILGSQAKVAALKDIAAKRKLSPKDFVAVGDGANDLPMLKTAGTGVALHAKPSVAAAAPICINHGDLTSLLYLQGYRQSDFSNE